MLIWFYSSSLLWKVYHFLQPNKWQFCIWFDERTNRGHLTLTNELIDPKLTCALSSTLTLNWRLLCSAGFGIGYRLKCLFEHSCHQSVSVLSAQSVEKWLLLQTVDKMFFTLLLVLVGLLFLWRNWVYSFWKRNQVPCPEPTFPIGNLGSIFTMKKHSGEVFRDWYKWVKWE